MVLGRSWERAPKDPLHSILTPETHMGSTVLCSVGLLLSPNKEQWGKVSNSCPHEVPHQLTQLGAN